MDYFLKRPTQITFAVNVSISCVMTGSTGIAHCTGWSLGTVGAVGGAGCVWDLREGLVVWVVSNPNMYYLGYSTGTCKQWTAMFRVAVSRPWVDREG